MGGRRDGLRKQVTASKEAPLEYKREKGKGGGGWEKWRGKERPPGMLGYRF